MALTSFILPSGYGLLVAWRPDTGAAVATSAVRPVAFADESEYRTLATGKRARVARRRAVAPEVVQEAVIRTLREWEGDGAEVRAVLVARGQGRHYQWEELTPALVEPFDGLPGQLQGDRLLLSSDAFGAEVYEDTNLLAPLSFTEAAEDAEGGWFYFSDGVTAEPVWGTDADGNPTATLSADAGETVALFADRVLPAPGLRVNFALNVGTIPAKGDATVRLTVTALTCAEYGYDEYGPPGTGYGAQAAAEAEEVFTEGDEGEPEALSYTIPAGTYAGRVALEIATDAGAGQAQAVTFSLPGLYTRALTGAPVQKTQWGVKVMDAGGERKLYTYGPASQAVATFTTAGGVEVEVINLTAPTGIVAAVTPPDTEAGEILTRLTLNTDD